MRNRLVVVPIASLMLGALVMAAEPPRPDGGYGADNTGQNVRDRERNAPTAGQQSSDADDVRITREIRQAVVADGSLSTNAQDVKIVTVDGVVTLRGPITSAKERARVASAAQQVPGVKKVDNRLEVTKR